MSPPAQEAQTTGRAEEPQVRSWERFFKKYCRESINEAVLGWPAKRSVVIDYFDLDKHDRKLAESLIDNPVQTLVLAEEALKAVDVPMEPRPKLKIRVKSLPAQAAVEVRHLRAEHLGKFVAVRGLIKKISDVRPKVQDALFQCNRCGAFIRESQEEHLTFKEPIECYEDQGGCGRDSSFKLIITETRGQASRFVDTQKLEVQENPETMRGGDQPQRLSLYAEDDLCGVVRPGERVTVNGVLRAHVKKKDGVKSTILDIFVETNYVEKEQQEFEEIETTEDEEAEIRRFSRDPEVYIKMRDSIAPTLYGMEVEKLMLLLQLFGGVEKHLPNGQRMRGDIHILLVGDPGVAKSELIRYMAGLAPRGIYTSGKSSSGAGLTAAAVKDEFGEGRWTLEAGAMVLADRGLLCVDEIDKMDKNDQSSMHEGMEQQSISVAKAGITATLQSRCSVLGAANPKNGRFDENEPASTQINFPPALMSRFDVIFVLLDKPDAGRDGKLASHLLNVHRGGGMQEQRKHDESRYSQEDVDSLLQRVEPPVGKDFLRKFVAYAKRNCHPVVSEEARDRLVNYYVELRRSQAGEAVPLTPRQLQALVRITEASARVRLAQEATIEDANRAIDIVEFYMRRMSGGSGIMDVDIIASGVSHNLRNSIQIVKQAIRELEAGTEHGAEYEDIVAHCETKGVPPDKVQDILQRLKQQGEIMETRNNQLRTVGR